MELYLDKPVQGYDWGDLYGWRPAIYSGGVLVMPAGLHDGVDIPAPQGTVVYAAAAGTVETVSWNSISGRFITINHGDGALTWYSHLSYTVVEPGYRVMRGQPIGKVGTTGASTGPHLHMSLFINGSTVDPLPYFSTPKPANPNNIGGDDMPWILIIKDGWHLIQPQGNGKPRAILLGGDSRAQHSGLPQIYAGRDQFTLDDLGKAIDGIRSHYLKA